MPALRRTTTLGASILATTALVLGATTAPASAADREFRYAGAEVDFDVEKDDGRFEVDVSVDDAAPGSRWRIVLRHDGQRFHSKVHRADDDGEVEVDKERRNTRGKDVFKLRIKKVGADKAATRVITRR